MSVWLETSALIGLAFCEDSEVKRCEAALPVDTERVVSRYVLFELARGYLSYFIKMHNESLECGNLADMHRRSYSGQRIHRAYERSAWLAAFTDYLACMEEDRNGNWGLEDLREKLWTKIRRGWKKCLRNFQPEAGCPCRHDLPPPTRSELYARIEQPLPMRDCGKAGTCGLLEYLRSHSATFDNMIGAEEARPGGDTKEKERKRRINGLRVLLELKGNSFKRGQCYSSADAIISHEARGHAVATKDKDLKPICKACGTEFVPVPHQ